jgi:hypothetical protein
MGRPLMHHTCMQLRHENYIPRPKSMPQIIEVSMSQLLRVLLETRALLACFCGRVTPLTKQQYVQTVEELFYAQVGNTAATVFATTSSKKRG